MDQIKQAVDAWLALAKHIIPEDDIRSQFTGWLSQAIDPDAPAPKQILVLRAHQGVGKTLLMAPFIRASVALSFLAAEGVSLPNSVLAKTKGLAVVEEGLSSDENAWRGLRRIANWCQGRAISLSNHVDLSGEPLDATGIYWAYDSRAEPLPPTFYADYLESLKAASGHEKEILAGIKASLNQR